VNYIALKKLRLDYFPLRENYKLLLYAAFAIAAGLCAAWVYSVMGDGVNYIIRAAVGGVGGCIVYGAGAVLLKIGRKNSP
jgi:hypothetical protein